VLRVWERRYGFPVPSRNALGERVYDEAQLQRLRHIRRLLDAGFRPSRVVPLPLSALISLHQHTAQRASRPSEQLADDSEFWMSFLYAQDSSGLRDALLQSAQKLGLMALLSQVVAPLNVAVGQAWFEGRLAVFEEHLYTETVIAVLRHALWVMRQTAVPQAPRILTTTLPGEAHGLGLLMAECTMADAQCTLQSLGLQTPVPDIVSAVNKGQIDVVALGFSGAQNPKDAFAALRQLRERLNPKVEIWSGGTNLPLQRLLQNAQRGHQPPLYWAMPALSDITAAVKRWRAAGA
jgi:methylmalonyl-CoA mutase cobalamin-binding subunit